MAKREILPMEADAVRARQQGLSYGQLKALEAERVQISVPDGLLTTEEWKALGKASPKYCTVCGKLLTGARRKFCSPECTKRHYRWLNAGKLV